MADSQAEAAGLTAEQQRVAEMVRRQAESLGVNPRLAMALAYRESGFTMKPGELDEIGIMQVRPGTAKQYGFSPKDLLDEEKNINIGLTILKSHLERFSGLPNQSAMAVAAYNTGPDHPFFSNPEKNPLPEKTQSYVKDISGLRAFEQPGLLGSEEPASSEETSGGQLTDQQRRDKLVEEVKELPGKVAQEYPTATRAAIDVAGASLGAQAGRFAETGRERAAQAAADLLRSSAQPAAPAVQPTATPPAPIPTDPMHTRQMQGTTNAGTTGLARQQTYNVGTSQQAAAANEQAKVIEQLKRQGLVSGDAKSLLAKAPGLTSTPSGVLLPSSQVYADIPPPQGTAPAPPAPAQPPQRPSALSRVTGGMSRGMQIAPRAFPGLTGMLGGLGAAELGQEAFRRGSEGDVIGSMIAGGGALGSAASLLPFPQTRVGGPAVAMVSPLALYLYDKAKDRAVSQAKGFGALASGAQLPAPSIYSGFTGP
jgi:hypothetical protein